VLTVAYPRADRPPLSQSLRGTFRTPRPPTYQGVNEDNAGHLRAAPHLPLAPDGYRNSQKMS